MSKKKPKKKPRKRPRQYRLSDLVEIARQMGGRISFALVPAEMMAPRVSVSAPAKPEPVEGNAP